MGRVFIVGVVLLFIPILGHNSTPTLSDIISKHNPNLKLQEFIDLKNAAESCSTRSQLELHYLLGLIYTESRFKPTARGALGEIGLMQLRPKFHALHISSLPTRIKVLYKVTENINTGCKYLIYIKENSKYTDYKWIEHYNRGLGRSSITFPYTKRVLKAANQFKGYTW